MRNAQNTAQSVSLVSAPGNGESWMTLACSKVRWALVPGELEGAEEGGVQRDVLRQAPCWLPRAYLIDASKNAQFNAKKNVGRRAGEGKLRPARLS